MATALPPSLKPLNSFLKLAKEYDKRDPTISYFCRMYSVQKGIKLDSKSPECKKFLFGLMDQLELIKKDLAAKGDESVTNDIVGQAHLENVAVNLFTWADGEDRKGVFNKNVVKAFYSSSLLYEVLTQFGELSEECIAQQRYAKWKATEIHKCMQNGEIPKPGPTGSGFEEDFGAVGGITTGVSDMQMPQPGNMNPSSNLPAAAGGFSYTQPVAPVPAPRRSSNSSSYVEDTAPAKATGDIDFTECLKYCKYAMSALNYEDVDTAVDNLQKTLNLLKVDKR